MKEDTVSNPTCNYLINKLFVQDYLVQALRDKMKSLRNAKPRNTKRELADAVTSPIKKQFKGKFPSTSKVQVTGEDKSSHEKHLQLLKDQEKEKCPDIDVVNGLMKRTFSMRGAEIVDNPIPIY